jgi:hypothetical protein
MFSEEMKKAFDAALDIIKQLITLSTAIIGGLFILPDKEQASRLVVKISGFSVPFSIYLLACSVFFGVFAHLSIIGELAKSVATPSVYKCHIRFFAGAQILSFAAAITFLAHAILQ